MPKVNVNASQLHYGMCTLATLPVIFQYTVHQHFDAGYGAWLVGFWLAAIGGDKLNTANPNTPNA